MEYVLDRREKDQSKKKITPMFEAKQLEECRFYLLRWVKLENK